MAIPVLFIQGGGEGAHAADQKLADSLARELGESYELRYPEMPEEEDAETEDWVKRIRTELEALEDGVVVVAHSYGGSALLKYLSDATSPRPMAGVFLIAAPYLGSGGWEFGVLDLERDGLQAALESVPITFYQSRDDEEVPFEHLALYRALVPGAAFREFDAHGGHQFGEDLAPVARDIMAL